MGDTNPTTVDSYSPFNSVGYNGSCSFNSLTGQVSINGNIGIGTTNPQAKLHVNGTLSTGAIFYPGTPSGIGTEGGFIVSKQVRINHNPDASVSPPPIQVFESTMNVTRMGSLLTISGSFNINPNSSTYSIRFVNRLGFTDCNHAQLVWSGPQSYITSSGIDASNNWLVLDLSGVPTNNGVQYIFLNCVIVLGYINAY